MQQTEQLTVPNADLHRVSLDTLPLVIGGTRTLTLRSEDGTIVPIDVVDLGQVQRPAVFVEGSPHWQPYTVRQLIPTEELLPSTEYTVSTSKRATGEENTAEDDSADAGVAAIEEVGRFTTATSDEPSLVASIPPGFELTYYSFGAGDTANCSGSGQVEFRGWQDNTFLELCIQYFTYTRYVESTFASEIPFDARPERQSTCTLAWRPFSFVLEEVEPVLWVESVTVRALGLGGSVSPPRLFERDNFEQFNAVMDDDGLAGEPFTPLEIPALQPDVETEVGGSAQSDPTDGNSAPDGSDPDSTGAPAAATGDDSEITSSGATSSQQDAFARRSTSGCSVATPTRFSLSGLVWFALLLGLKRRRSLRRAARQSAHSGERKSSAPGKAWMRRKLCR